MSTSVFTYPSSGPYRSLEEWVGLAGPLARADRAVLLRCHGLFPILCDTYGLTGIEAPQIRVFESGAASAEISPYTVQVSTALLDLCLQPVPVRLADYPNTAGLATINDPTAPAWLGFGWVLAHEYHHIIRRHSDLRANGETAFMATEADSDMCAVAAIFRAVQSLLGPTATDLDIAVNAAYQISWILWRLPHSIDRSVTHPPLISRLYFICTKLASLSATGFNRSSLDDFKSEDFVATLIRIVQAFSIAEKHARQSSGFVQELIDYLATGHFLELSRTWDELAPAVEELSGRRAVVRDDRRDA